MQWIFMHYDTNLVRKDLFKIKLPNPCQYMAACFSNDKLYLLLQKTASRKDTLKNYLLEWDIVKSDFQLYDLQNYKYPYLTSIKVVNDFLFIVVNEQKSKSIIHYNFKTHAKQTTQYIEDEITTIESFEVDTIGKTTCFCMFLKNKQGSRAELFITDYSGNLKQRTAFPFYPELVYNSSKATMVGRDTILLTGGYSYIKDKKRSGCYSGIYTLLFVKNRFVDINTHTFGALLAKDSVVNARYLGEANLTMNTHIKQQNEHVFAITEAFYPEYQYTNGTSSYRSLSYYGYEPPTRIFSGFRFLNAYILEFDAQGVLVNEWYFPIQNVLTQSLYNLVNLYQDKEGSCLFYYTFKNEVVSQFLHGQHVLEAQAAKTVELLSKTDIVEYNSSLVMQHWYENKFLLSGYQYIKNFQRTKGKRYVFFLNKMICE